MRRNITQVAVEDADELAHGWGVGIAMQMLSEGVISPKDFLWLCAGRQRRRQMPPTAPRPTRIPHHRGADAP